VKAVEVLSIVAMSLFGVMGIFLFSKRQAGQKGLGWLGAFFVLLALNYLDGILLLNGTILRLPSLAFWEDPMVLLYGPFLYFFIIGLKEGKATMAYSQIFHFLPFIVAEGIVIVYHAQASAEDTSALLNKIVSEERDLVVFLGMIPLFAHVITYIVLAIRTLSRHRQLLKQFYSTVEIDWAFSLLTMVMVIFMTSFVSTVFQLSGMSTIYAIALMVVILLSILLTLRILLIALNQPVFHAAGLREPSLNLPDTEKGRLQHLIDRALNEEKLFRNPDLSLKDLATHTGAPERSVSYVINIAMAENFYDLVNKYRIEEARRILESTEDPKLTILEVLYQVGFNSKSSFNTQFKKKTGLTPTEFRKLHRKG
jgi:AraC-like DNA-binding protein